MTESKGRGEDIMKKEVRVSTDCIFEVSALAKLVGIANNFSSTLSFDMDNKIVNVKSIMGIMGFGLDLGKEVSIYAEGDDEAEAISAMEEFLTK